MGEDERISELMDRARSIEEELFDDGFSPREVLFIATLISHSASRLMDKGGEQEEEEYDADEEYSGDEPSEVKVIEEEEYEPEKEPEGEPEPPEEPDGDELEENPKQFIRSD